MQQMLVQENAAAVFWSYLKEELIVPPNHERFDSFMPEIIGQHLTTDTLIFVESVAESIHEANNIIITDRCRQEGVTFAEFRQICGMYYAAYKDEIPLAVEQFLQSNFIYYQHVVSLSGIPESDAELVTYYTACPIFDEAQPEMFGPECWGEDCW